jgi:hypothetical protein
MSVEESILVQVTYFTCGDKEMLHISKSAKLYQERRQPEFQKTMRAPGFQANLAANLVHNLKLEPPFPQPDFCKNGHPVTDTGRTQVWPYGDAHS